MTPERTPGEQEVSRSERTVTVPIGEMDEPAGYLSIRAPVRGRDEIGQLARQFDHMAEQLKASFARLAAERDSLRRVGADAAHGLHTPITAFKNFNQDLVMIHLLLLDDNVHPVHFSPALYHSRIVLPVR